MLIIVLYMKFRLHNIPVVFKIFSLLTCIQNGIQFIYFSCIIFKLESIILILLSLIVTNIQH